MLMVVPPQVELVVRVIPIVLQDKVVILQQLPMFASLPVPVPPRTFVGVRVQTNRRTLIIVAPAGTPVMPPTAQPIVVPALVE